MRLLLTVLMTLALAAPGLADSAVVPGKATGETGLTKFGAFDTKAMSGSINLLECTASGTFPLLTPVGLVDVSTLQNEVLPAGALVTGIYAHAESTFSGLGTLSIGWAGNTGALVAPGDGLTAGGLNAADWRKIPATFSAPTAGETLTVTATGLATTGEIRVKIYYETFD